MLITYQAGAQSSFKSAVDKAISTYGKSAQWSIKIQRAKDGSILYQKNTALALIPASNRKIMTSLLALQLLGPDYKYETKLYHTGAITSKGHLKGNLVIKAAGDPTFGNVNYNSSMTSTLTDWAKKLKAKGVKYIHGDLVIDCTGFANDYNAVSGIESNDPAISYAARPHALAFNQNCVVVRFKPSSKVGAPVIIEVEPPGTAIIKNNGKTGKKGSRETLRITREKNSEVIEIAGSMPFGKLKQSRQIAIKNPALVAGKAFKDILKKNGVHVEGNVKVTYKNSQKNTALIAKYESPSLARILHYVNKNSNNFTAEQIFQTASIKAGEASYEKSRSLEKQFWAVKKMDLRGFENEDGSGLSRDNKCSSGFIVQLLMWTTNQKYWRHFKESLAVSGKSGTLRRRLSGSSLSGRVFAKTGTINRVKALSGYYITPKGTIYVFSILSNDISSGSGTAAQNKILEALAKYYGNT